MHKINFIPTGMRLLIFSVAVYLAIMLGVVLVSNITGNLHISGWILIPITIPAVIWSVIYAPLMPLRKKTLDRLRNLSSEELEKTTFQIPYDYFKYIGENHPAVIRFKEIAEAKDASSLNKEWNKLERTFLSLERKAGHRGRPMLLEYFCWYDLYIKSLLERSRKDGVT